jgi:hypothetical protein
MSSCHALVRTLQFRGFVHILDERKRVYPTKRLLIPVRMACIKSHRAAIFAATTEPGEAARRIDTDLPGPT